MSVGQAVALLASDVLSERVRGLERLGSAGTPRAVERLIRSVQPGSGAATPEERLTAVRELAAHTSELGVTRALGRVLGGHAASAEQRGPLDELAQTTAALALARAGTSDALAALGKALSGGGSAAKAAEEAVIAYPPRDLSPLVTAAPIATEELASTLAELADQRAFGLMRSLVQTGPPVVRARAAIGLTELGDYETVALARLWVRPDASDTLRIAGARILAMAHEPDGAAAIRSLLEDDASWRAGAALTLESPSADLAPALAKRLVGADRADSEQLIAGLGRCGGRAAVDALERLLGAPGTAVFAAATLARVPDPAALDALERALERREVRRTAALALAMRRALGNGTSDAALGELAKMLRSKDSDDRAAGAAGLAVFDPSRIAALLQSKDARIVTSAAAALLVAPIDAVHVAASVLERTTDSSARAALSLCLAYEEAERDVPTDVLLSLVDDKGIGAPLAARALAARDEDRTRSTVDALLASEDARLRLHAALGLARSANPDASGRLANAYRFEANPDVRRAIVVALSGRAAPIARRTLSLAAGLDPDPKTRSAARLALGGDKLFSTTRGMDALLFAKAAERPGPPEALALTVRAPNGIELPVASGPDGIVFAVGLPRGSAVAVAPGDEGGKDSDRGASAEQKDDRNGAQ